jgi:hypothetical protein
MKTNLFFKPDKLYGVMMVWIQNAFSFILMYMFGLFLIFNNKKMLVLK